MKDILVISKGGDISRISIAAAEVIDSSDLRRELRSTKIVRRLFSYREVYLHLYRRDVLFGPLGIFVLMRILSRGKCFLIDDSGNKENLSIVDIFKSALAYIHSMVDRKNMLRDLEGRVSDLLTVARKSSPESKNPNEGPILYLRTDLWYGIRAGGSVGHIAGVLNNLWDICASAVFVTTDPIPMVDAQVETYVLPLCEEYRESVELASLNSNHYWREASSFLFEGRKWRFIYQRHSLNNFLGLEIALRRQLPFVLEYNGSEVWVNRNWGKPLKYERYSSQIELLNLLGADLVVVVSQVLADEVVEKGVEERRVLVNPNGVDPVRFSTAVSGQEVRQQLGLGDRKTIGFIGTFGRWHGVEVLVESYARLLQKSPALRTKTALVLIGDGLMMPEVQHLISKHAIEENVICTGIIPQEQGPSYLAACDVLVSPHVPNKDGSPFLGSPTKLFEYMAMGKGIVASALGQIGDILRHKETAYLVEPGNLDELVEGIQILLEDVELRENMGSAARREVVEKYTWEAHTQRIIDRLERLVGPGCA